MKKIIYLLLILFLFTKPACATLNTATVPRISVDAGGHFFEDPNGNHFFPVMSTAYTMRRLTVAEARYYMNVRKAQGINTFILNLLVISSDDETTPSGDATFTGDVYGTENEDYFTHIDNIVNLADELGLYLVFYLQWCNGSGTPFTNSEALMDGYADFVSARYTSATSVVALVVAGECTPDADAAAACTNAKVDSVGTQLSAGATNTLVSAHPVDAQTGTGGSSSTDLDGDAWLDFNMTQTTSMNHDNWNYQVINDDFDLGTPKPVIEAENMYEDFDNNGSDGGSIDHNNIRYRNWHALIAGAAGIGVGDAHTYRFHKIADSLTETNRVMYPWKVAMDTNIVESYGEIIHLSNLVKSRPWIGAAPDDNVITSTESTGANRRSCISNSTNWAVCYITDGTAVTVDRTQVGTTVTDADDPEIVAWWYNPRTGEVIWIGESPNTTTEVFTPPTSEDWVLVLDDQTQEYDPPGIH